MKSRIVDITDRKELNRLMSRLTPGTPASWGNLNAQSMIEHLVEAVEYTNGNRAAVLLFPLEEANKIKRSLVYGDFAITPGAKGYLSDATRQKRFSDLQSAIDELNKQIDAFEVFFQTADRTSIHQEFGPMNHNEWIIWHGKHFAHHFKQFGLIDTEPASAV